MKDRLQEAKMHVGGLARKRSWEPKQQNESCMHDVMFNRRVVGSESDQAGDWYEVRTE